MPSRGEVSNARIEYDLMFLIHMFCWDGVPQSFHSSQLADIQLSSTIQIYVRESSYLQMIYIVKIMIEHLYFYSFVAMELCWSHLDAWECVGIKRDQKFRRKNPLHSSFVWPDDLGRRFIRPPKRPAEETPKNGPLWTLGPAAHAAARSCRPRWFVLADESTGRLIVRPKRPLAGLCRFGAVLTGFDSIFWPVLDTWTSLLCSHQLYTWLSLFFPAENIKGLRGLIPL